MCSCMNKSPTTNNEQDGRVCAQDADALCTSAGRDSRSPESDEPLPVGEPQDVNQDQLANVNQDEEPLQEDLTQPCEDFDDMNLTEDLLRGIYGYGFEKP